MEHSGRNQGNRWQMLRLVDRGNEPKPLRRLRLVAATQNGKEGVSGSSPEEGSAKAAEILAFSVERTWTSFSVL
jgi:hypothetical protein